MIKKEKIEKDETII